MESDEERWMDKFHNRVQEEQETKELRKMVEQLAVKVNEGESMRRENEQLKLEQEQMERERIEDQENVDVMTQFVLNNFTKPRGMRKTTDELNRRRYQRDVGCSTEDELNPARSSSVRQKTPPGYGRATDTEPEIFLRKQKKTRKEYRRAKAEYTDTTESERSDEEQPVAIKEKQRRTPWPLKRENKLEGKERFQRRMEQGRTKEITPEPFSGDVNLSEYLSQFEACAEWNEWTERQK